MTLVVAHRFGNNISLSSDSRIAYNANEYFDHGAKIFSIPVKIYNPVDRSVFDIKIGMAVIGSLTATYTVKESVYEILQNLQYAPNRTKISMDNISKIIFDAYKYTIGALAPILRDKVNSELIITGFCNQAKKMRAFHISCSNFRYDYESESTRIDWKIEEVLVDNYVCFYGSGKEAAEEIHTQNRELQPLQILRIIIHSGKVKSVGGGMQHGCFDSFYNFKVLGVVDYSYEGNGNIKYQNTFRGINWYSDEFFHGIDNHLVPALTFEDAFKQETIDKFKEWYMKSQ